MAGDQVSISPFVLLAFKNGRVVIIWYFYFYEAPVLLFF